MHNSPVLEIDEGGTKRWYSNDKLHREDGPAIERSNGNKLWFLNGERHRTDGPAIEFIDGSKFWYLNNIKYSFEEWLKKAPLSAQEKVKLRLKYGQ